jgi:hypothetical protein
VAELAELTTGHQYESFSIPSAEGITIEFLAAPKEK